MRMKMAIWLGSAAALVGVVGFGLRSRHADAACCYFAAKDKDINQPGQKAFVTWDAAQKLESFTVQPRFEGNAVDFGMVVPTPARPKLDEMPRDFFKDLAIYTILMPLPEGIYTELDPPVPCPSGAPNEGAGPDAGNGPVHDPKKKVTVLEAGVVGSLDYKIILAEDATGLFDWLKENSYVYGGDKNTLDFYIQKKWVFTVMKIDPKQMKKAADGSYVGDVTPTRFAFSSDKCVYPLKITQLSVKDQTDALFYVQAAQEMDLEGDFSWKHSYRVMWLTYMLGCSANEEQQKELATRTQWVEGKKAKDAKYETTKLEWAKKLGDGELSVVEDPLKNYSQAGGGDLPAGFTVIALDDFLKEIRAAYETKNANAPKDRVDARLKELAANYPASKGQIVKNPKPGSGFYYTTYLWCPHREAPDEDVKGLSRLKGMLQKGQWLTKFRKILRKEEMTDDLVLVPVEAGKEDEYVRIMPTSPP